MGHIPDLKDIELDSYSNFELEEFAIRIVGMIGSSGAWRVLEASGDAMSAESKVVINAVRQNPDNPLGFDTMVFVTPTKTLEDAQKTTIPMISLMAMNGAICYKKLGTDIGIGPHGIAELVVAGIRMIENENMQ